MVYTLAQSGLNVRKGRGKNEYSVYKYNTAIFVGINGRENAQNIMLNQYKNELRLRN